MPLSGGKNDVHFQSDFLQTCLQLEQHKISVDFNSSWIGLLASQLSAVECLKISLYGVFVMQKPVLISVPVPVLSTVSPKVTWSLELYLYIELTVPQVSDC